jgi:hypothetical protein
LAATKKRICKRLSGPNITGPFSARNCFHRQVNYGAVGVSLASQYCCTHLVRVVPNIACYQERSWNGDDFPGCNRRIKDVIDVVEVFGMISKIGHHVRIGYQESRCSARDRKRGQPVSALRQLSGEQPNALLIVEKVFRHGPPCRFAFCLSAMFYSG